MRLILLKLGPINVYSYGLMIAIGVLFAVALFLKRTNRLGLNEDNVLNMIFITILSGVLGGKLLYIITDFKTVQENGGLFKKFGEGFVIYGAIIGGMLALYTYCKRKQWSFMKVMDAVIPGLALAQGFGRIGCFLAGCCYGAETKVPWAVVYPIESLAPSGLHLHPTQIYSAIFDFALAAFLLWYEKRDKKDGRIFAMYLIMYSIGRFLVEFLRNDPRGNVGVLSTSQFISIFVFMLGLIMWRIDIFIRRRIKSE